MVFHLLTAKAQRLKSVNMLIETVLSDSQLALSTPLLNEPLSLSIVAEVSVYGRAIAGFSIEYISGQFMP
jgi:hypothetical protein